MPVACEVCLPGAPPNPTRYLPVYAERPPVLSGTWATLVMRSGPARQFAVLKLTFSLSLTEQTPWIPSR